MKKIGLLALALVLALGTLGVAYAMWWDDLTISGSISTNTVSIGFTEFDCTEKYECPVGSGVFYNGEYEGKDVATVTCGYGGGSYFTDECTDLSGYKVGSVTIEDGYPCHWTFITFVIKNLGTTPVIIQQWQPVDPTGELEWDGVDSLCAYNPDTSEYDIPILRFRSVNLVGDQLHSGEEGDKAEIDVHIEQPAEMNDTYSFDIVIQANQWNESDVPANP
jgi:hypothetical protein